MKYEEIKQNNKDSIVIQKQGIFYIVYNEDTYIMNYLFNYQVKSSNNKLKVGFPNIDKVIKELNRLKINYIVINETKKKFKNNNYYKYSINNITRINKIISKLKNNISNENVINKIERLL